MAEVQASLRSGLATTAVPKNLYPPLAIAASYANELGADGCLVEFAPTTSPPCVFGSSTPSRTVVLLGDSHAAQWFPALNAVGQEEGWRIVVLTKVGCPAPDVLVHLPHTDGKVYTACDTWRAWAWKRLKALRPSLVLVSWDRTISQGSESPPPIAGMPAPPRTYGTPWLNGVEATFDMIKSAGAKTIFMSDTPLMAQPVPECLAANLKDARACTRATADAVFDPALKVEEIKIAEAAGAEVIDPTTWLCTPKACPVIVGNVLVYRDEDHLTPTIVNWLTPLFRLELLLAVA